MAGKRVGAIAQPSPRPPPARFLALLLGLVLIGTDLGLRATEHRGLSRYLDTQVVVVTLYPGHAAEEIEQQVSVPIERALNSVPRHRAALADDLWSVGRGTHIRLRHRRLLRASGRARKLRDASLPDGVTPTLGPMSTPIGELYRYTSTPPLACPTRCNVCARSRTGSSSRGCCRCPVSTDITPFRRPDQTVPDRGRPDGTGQITASRFATSPRRWTPTTRTPAAPCPRQPSAIAGRARHRDIASVEDIENIVVSESGGVPVLIRDMGACRSARHRARASSPSTKPDRCRGHRADATR